MHQKGSSVDAHTVGDTGLQSDERVPVARDVQTPADDPQSQLTPRSESPSPHDSVSQDEQSDLEPAADPQIGLTDSKAVANEVDPITTPTAAAAPDTPSSVPEPPVSAEGSQRTSRASVPIFPTQAAESDGHDEPFAQTPSSALHSPSVHRRSLTVSTGHTVSVVLISTALEAILSSKDAKRSPPLRDSAQKALEMVRAGKGGDRPREIFEPLRLACETRSEKLMIASLDCISKLISYSFFAEESSAPLLPSPPPSPILQGQRSVPGSQANIPQPSLVDLVVHTITACHTEATPETVSLQVVKALLALILSPTIYVHHSSLLKAVRTVYNIFLLSTDAVNQMVAQGGLTQMVHHVFTRCSSGKSVDSDEGVVPRSSISSETLPSPAHHHAASNVETQRSSLVSAQLASDSTHTGNVETENTSEPMSSISPGEVSADFPAEPEIPHPSLDGQGHGEEGCATVAEQSRMNY